MSFLDFITELVIGCLSICFAVVSVVIGACVAAIFIYAVYLGWLQ